MTTVACNLQTMAADSFIGNAAGARTTKIFKIGNEIIGFAGGLADALRLLEWVQDARRGPPPIPEDKEDRAAVDMLILRRSGIYMFDGFGVEIKLDGQFAAIGSGAEYAMGAMAVGASPEAAVAVACEYDAGTRGPVCSINLKGKR
jgi:ATP-dependent protease HslVU (ClpYQ) peptidase subunit